MKNRLARSVLVFAAATLVSGCTIVDESATEETKTARPTASASVSPYPMATGQIDTRLTITMLTGNAMEVSTRHLICSGSAPVSGTDFADADKACAIVREFAEAFELEPQPFDEDKCRGTGDQHIADVVGEIDRVPIRTSFMRNNLCNVETWDKLTDVIGPEA